MSSIIEKKIEKKQTSSKLESKKKKAISNEQKQKEQKMENQVKETIKNFEKLLLERDKLNKSQKNFFDSNQIKIGER